MDWASGVPLFRDICSPIHDSIAEEPAERRTAIISQILAAFALSGADIRELYGHSDDVDAALASLGVGRKTDDNPFDPFTIRLIRVASGYRNPISSSMAHTTHGQVDLSGFPFFADLNEHGCYQSQGRRFVWE